MFKLAPKQPSHDDLFIQRYSVLLAWARKLTEGDRQRAEDLVQDIFVQFTLARPDLDSIENIDGYLHRMLRNRNLSNIRRNNRRPFERASSVEYDSAEAGLRALDPVNRFLALEELRAICRYACARAEASKAGSILILRFFHGYYPSEIVRLAGISRESVDTWLRIARGEARAYLQDPARLAFLRGAGDRLCGQDPSIRSGDVLQDLRTIIFNSRIGD